MDVLHTVVKIGVYVLLGVSAVAAVAAVTAKNIFHAALCLIAVLIGTAGLYIALEAEFLAVVQILLYVGAIMTLVIFSIMMTEGLANKNISASNHLNYPAIAGSLGLLAILTYLFLGTPWKSHAAGELARVSTSDLGQSLLTKYVFPFEVISVFLIAALIGAIIVAKKETKS